jgi:hypothetical protein
MLGLAAGPTSEASIRIDVIQVSPCIQALSKIWSFPDAVRSTETV